MMNKSELENPWIINIELTNACNLECIFCDHRILKKQMRIKHMDDQLLMKIFSDIKSEVKNEKIYELGLVGLGEPTLDRYFERHMQMINENAYLFERISFNSNLVSLKKKRAEILMKSMINSYTFSVNASNKKMYLKLMQRDCFDLVINNLKFFMSLLKKKDKKPRIAVQILDSDETSLKELKSLFPEAEGINFFVRKVYSKPVIQDGTGLLNVYKSNESTRYPCWDIYTRIYIDVEGNLYPCTMGNDCYRESSSMWLGNITTNSIFDLFNSQKIQEARRLSEQGIIPFPDCEKCNIWSLTPNNFIWDGVENVWKKKKKQVRAYNLKGGKWIL